MGHYIKMIGWLFINNFLPELGGALLESATPLLRYLRTI